jgi:hypothetical protein
LFSFEVLSRHRRTSAARVQPRPNPALGYSEQVGIVLSKRAQKINVKFRADVMFWIISGARKIKVKNFLQIPIARGICFAIVRAPFPQLGTRGVELRTYADNQSARPKRAK